MQLLERPTFLDEPMGEPIQQLRMSGPVAHSAKIARSTNQAFSKMVLPYAVYNDSSRQRILRARNPLGQGQPAQTAAFWSREGWLRVHEHRRHPGGDF